MSEKTTETQSSCGLTRRPAFAARKAAALAVSGLAMLALMAACAFAVAPGLLGSLLDSRARAGGQPDGSRLLVTQQVWLPSRHQRLIQGRPADMAFNHTGSQLAILNMRGVELRDEQSGAIAEITTRSTSYCGIAYRPGDRELWVSEADQTGTGSLLIETLDEAGKGLGQQRVELPGKAFPTGIAFVRDGRQAYVALNSRNSIAVIDAETRSVTREIPVDRAPMFVMVSPDQKTLYVSNRGGVAPAKGAGVGLSDGTAMATDATTGAVLNGTVSVINLADYSVRTVVVGRAPTALALAPDTKTIAVANSHSDSVTLINRETLAARTISIPTIPDGLLGTAPVALTFAPDGHRLYVAAALSNSVVVLDPSGDTFKIAGAIPTDWYPTSLAFDRSGALVVLNIKGDGNTSDGHGGFNTHSYQGSELRIHLPTNEQLAAETQLVRAANNPRLTPQGGIANLDSLGIRHVFLIVKENRTYDQVFGDERQADSDPKFLMYGQQITPNHHALAEQFVLLDNFYATGAISFDGHQWLEQGFVSDNVERALNSHPRGYAWNLADSLDVSPAGFIWQHAQRPLEVRVGGVLSLPAEFNPETQKVRDITEDDLKPWAEYWKLYKAGQWRGAVGSRPAVPALASVMDLRYPVNSMKMPDQIRASVLIEELAEAEKTRHLPDLMVLGMTSDHTMGTTPGSPTPSAMVADNDYALGRMVEAISKSSFWPSSLILVVEDDAQNGVDHVDGHRTVALAIGPNVRRGVVDSNFYTQLSMARTMQDILHVTPQTHFLRNARAMNTVFTARKDLRAYTAIPPNMPLDTMNPPLAALSGRARAAAVNSASMNWNHVDDLPTADLNQILWWDRRGYSEVLPPSHSSKLR